MTDKSKSVFGKGGVLDPADPFTPLLWFAIILGAIMASPFIILIVGSIVTLVLRVFGIDTGFFN